MPSGSYRNLADLDSTDDWQVPVEYQIGVTYEKLSQPQMAVDTYKAILARETAAGTNSSSALQSVFDMARWRLNLLSGRPMLKRRIIRLFFPKFRRLPFHKLAIQPCPMNSILTPLFIQEMAAELRSYLTLCEEILHLSIRENQALSGQISYQPVEFQEKRRHLLPTVQTLLAQLRRRRIVWQQTPKPDRDRCTEITFLFQNIQDQLMKILLLDRENQQIMLRRGMVPANHLPAPAPKPNYLASVYRSHATPGA